MRAKILLLSLILLISIGGIFSCKAVAKKATDMAEDEATKRINERFAILYPDGSEQWDTNKNGKIELVDFGADADGLYSKEDFARLLLCVATYPRPEPDDPYKEKKENAAKEAGVLAGILAILAVVNRSLTKKGA